jgi:hypothetical protein
MTTETWTEVGPGTSWTGGKPEWHASRYFLMRGPIVERVCLTPLGARFAAWRRRRAEAKGRA